MNIWQTIKQQPATLVWAIVIHILAFIAIAVSFKSSVPAFNQVKKENIIEAVAIDEKKINAEINKLKNQEKLKKREERRLQANVSRSKKERRNEEKKLLDLRKKQKEEEQLNKIKSEQEKKRLAALEKNRQEQELKQRLAEERLAELDKQQQEKQMQLLKAEKEREKAEKDRAENEKQKKRSIYQEQEVNRYKGLIRNQITRKWVVPASYQKGMKCKILVRLIPSGDVVSVAITQSSGNNAFDRSVEMAVQSASPLPVPKSDTGLFDHFREVEFVFDPDV